MNVIDNIRNTFQRQSKLTVMIIINVAVFLTVNIGINIAHVYLVPYLGLPVSLYEFPLKFWTLLTYMFTHEGLMHAFYNLILLFFSGQIFYSILGEKRLVYVYVMSGFFGGLFYLLLGYFLPHSFGGTYLIGASAAVMGVIGVVALYAPNMPVNLFMLIEIPYKYFALLVFVMSTVIDFAVNTGGKISHLGGMAFGLFYGYSLKNGKDLFDFTIKNKSKNTLKVVHRSEQTSTKSGKSEEDYLNRLLDKISKSGYDSLSKKEKEDLFHLSQKK